MHFHDKSTISSRESHKLCLVPSSYTKAELTMFAAFPHHYFRSEITKVCSTFLDLVSQTNRNSDSQCIAGEIINASGDWQKLMQNNSCKLMRLF
jgi:hypothetical protein